MAEKLKLSKPVEINGEEYTEIPYDFESMTIRDKMNASKRMKSDGIPMSNIEELDPDHHIYLFAQAVSKADPSIDISDIMRIDARVGVKGGRLARSFFYFDSEE